jgi:hypothetical protein
MSAFDLVNNLLALVSTERKINALLTERNKTLTAQHDMLLVALEAVEWEQIDVPRNIFECPWCQRRKHEGHTSNCLRQAAIRKARGQ